MSDYRIFPIGFVHSPYTQKFGVPRQPGLVPAAEVSITLLPEFGMDCVRGLNQFEYIWVQFIFHDVLDEGWSALVRPPRLGGTQKMGVFATRSPHRPNHLGLSLLKLEGISKNNNKQICLLLSGADLLDGTPVIDIKPYLPFVEAQSEAGSGYVSGPPQTLDVHWQPQALAALAVFALDHNYRLLVEQSIAQDPRPAYQNIPQRLYVMRLGYFDVCFQIEGRQANIVDVRAIEQNNIDI